MKIITEKLLEKYRVSLYEDEKSRATIEKYLRDVRKLAAYADGREITKSLMISFKEKLYHVDHYKISSVNSFLETVNRFLEYAGWYGERVKPYRVQPESFCPEERHLSRDEYKRLLAEARRQKKKRLFLMLETMASTGMRVSELKCVDAAGVRAGMVEVQNKGKIRKVLLTRKMQRQLLAYIREEKLGEGMVFRTRRGNAVDRSSVWKEMKKLCEGAGIEESKVFPHNLRKLFASCLYRVQGDIARVADFLGHSSMETTRRYLRKTSKEYGKVLERMNLVEETW
jgi:site-specific recombinase XerD